MDSAKTKQLTLQVFAWLLSGIAATLAITAWLQAHGHDLAHLTTYNLFPLFGLLAFSIMWTHYIVSVLRQYLHIDGSATKLYFEVTSFIVLLAIVAHPGLLIWQLFRDGHGLPPLSYIHYVKSTSRIAVEVGSLSWFIFIAYEFRRWFSKKSWWKYIGYAGDAAMLGIFYHSITLGDQLQHGWLRAVWFFYGITLVISLGLIYYQRMISIPPKAPSKTPATTKV